MHAKVPYVSLEPGSIAVDDPFDDERQRLVFALTAKYPRIAVAAPTVLERAIARVYGTMIG